MKLLLIKQPCFMKFVNFIKSLEIVSRCNANNPRLEAMYLFIHKALDLLAPFSSLLDYLSPFKIFFFSF